MQDTESFDHRDLPQAMETEPSSPLAVTIAFTTSLPMMPISDTAAVCSISKVGGSRFLML